jgi:hypothetical protein
MHDDAAEMDATRRDATRRDASKRDASKRSPANDDAECEDATPTASLRNRSSKTRLQAVMHQCTILRQCGG